MVALVDDSERNAAVEIEDAGVRMGMADRDNGIIETADANDVVDGNETSTGDIDGDGNEQMADKGGRGGSRPSGSRPSGSKPSWSRPSTPSFSPPSFPSPYYRPSYGRPTYRNSNDGNRMSCTSGTTMHCSCYQGGCDMNRCKNDCSCDGGGCSMKGCKYNCSCHGGNCNGASSMHYGMAFSTVVVAIVTSLLSAW